MTFAEEQYYATSKLLLDAYQSSNVSIWEHNRLERARDYWEERVALEIRISKNNGNPPQNVKARLNTAFEIWDQFYKEYGENVWPKENT